MNRFLVVIALALLLTTGMIFAASWSTSYSSNSTITGTNSTYTINLARKSSIGNYLVDSNGMTLYYFVKDPSGMSSCNGECLKLWTPFYTNKITVPKGLSASDFTVIKAENGKPQIAYKGWPLYLFSEDTKPGETNGQGFYNYWYVMNPDYTVMIANNSKYGNYLVDSKGMTLYYLGAEKTTGKMKCNGLCLDYWPLFYTNSVVVPGGLKASDFSVITRPGGKKQIEYMGVPLYYFIADSGRGDVKGQDLKDPFGTWYIINPQTFKNNPKTTSASPVTKVGQGGY